MTDEKRKPGFIEEFVNAPGGFISIVTLRNLKIVIALVAVCLTSGLIAVYDTTSTAEIGYRGVGMQVTQSDGLLAQAAVVHAMPPSLPPAPAGGALASEEYQNVQVLGHLTTAQFTRLMTAITTWVAPQQGCAYCHNTNNLASDEIYTKVVARRMLQMTQHINENWQVHVQGVGVTCYTCHRGQAVPNNIWFDVPDPNESRYLGNRAHQNAPGVALTSLPNNVFETYLADDMPIRVQGSEVIADASNRHSIKQTEWTYGLMVHFSQALGVNCTYCHNSRSWASWDQSPAVRGRAWYGIRMVRNVNHSYLGSLQDVFPEHRLGPTGDVAKVNCATCHQGAYRPLLGAHMLDDYPSLSAPGALAAGAEPPAEEPEPEAEAPADRDGDGVSDHFDNCPDEPGTIENAGCEAVQQVIIRDNQLEIVGKVYFRTGLDEIEERSFPLLDDVARVLNVHPEIEHVVVAGHTDAQGDHDSNVDLSRRRAAAVAVYLVEQGGVNGERLEARGYGPDRPVVAEASSPEEHAQNRRVEFRFDDEAEVEGTDGAAGVLDDAGDAAGDTLDEAADAAGDAAEVLGDALEDAEGAARRALDALTE